jgi:hypothetical protein
MVVKLTPIVPPRAFEVGRSVRHVMRDCARVELAPDEQVTFVTDSGGEYDVARKSWGFYATPSLNARLARFGLRPALVKNPEGRYFIFLVERGKDAEFEQYLTQEAQRIVCWLDSDKHLADLERALGTTSA